MVASFPPNGSKSQAAEGGIYPAWSRDGRELFYFHGAGIFASVRVHPGPVFTTSAPTDHWPQGPNRAMMSPFRPHRGFDPVADGRFLSLLRTLPRDAPQELKVVVNWFQELTTKR